VSVERLRRLEALDAMRGLAALIVVWSHAADYLFRGGFRDAYDVQMMFAIDATDPGRIGVICFFLISGFIVPSSLAGGEGAIKKFAIKRFFRLFPAYWVSLILAIVVDFLVLGKTYPLAQQVANATMIQNVLGQGHIQGLYWTLQVELFFYVFCAWIFSRGGIGSSRFILSCLIASVISFALFNFFGGKLGLINKHSKELFYTPFLLSVMLLGTLVRIWFDTRLASDLRLAELGGLVVVGIPLVNFFASIFGIILVSDPGRFLFSHLVGGALFFGTILFWQAPSKIFLRLGAVSYSIYLFHPIAMHLVAPLRFGDYFSQYLKGSLFLEVAIAMAASVLLAELVYRFCEQPCNDMGRRVCKKLGL
jgi:peptidoglycan/LPS O-acetylase OafA/YrhL